MHVTTFLYRRLEMVIKTERQQVNFTAEAGKASEEEKQQKRLAETKCRDMIFQ